MSDAMGRRMTLSQYIETWQRCKQALKSFRENDERLVSIRETLSPDFPEEGRLVIETRHFGDPFYLSVIRSGEDFTITPIGRKLIHVDDLPDADIYLKDFGRDVPSASDLPVDTEADAVPNSIEVGFGPTLHNIDEDVA